MVESILLCHGIPMAIYVWCCYLCGSEVRGVGGSEASAVKCGRRAGLWFIHFISLETHPGQIYNELGCFACGDLCGVLSPHTAVIFIN